MSRWSNLWELGHRSIVCVSDDRTNDGRLRSRLYEQFMRDHGAADHIAVHISDQEPEPSYQVGRLLFAADAIPPLTTVSQSGVEMGRAAAELLVQMIEAGHGTGDTDDVVMTPRLVTRQSTAPVDAG